MDVRRWYVVDRGLPRKTAGWRIFSCTFSPGAIGNFGTKWLIDNSGVGLELGPLQEATKVTCQSRRNAVERLRSVGLDVKERRLW